jgi:UDP-GlcNAc:undecaprenyl-phosphate GlcNAc-1-phosphate transferase
MEVQTKQIIFTALLFIVPLTDTTTVSINRMLRGKSPFVGGKDHTTHHLAYMGIKERHVPVLLGCITIAASAVALGLVYMATGWSMTDVALYGALVLVIMGGLYSITRIKKQHHG